MSGIPKISVEMAREVALSQGVCIRPIVRRVLDRATGTEDTVPIPCGSRRESVCPPCAHKARVIRMQQCAEGWHRTDELNPDDQAPQLEDEDGEEAQDPLDEEMGTGEPAPARRTRSTRRRDPVDLPRVPVEDRTVGRTFTAPDGTTYRPSMFLTLTLPSYGRVRDGVPVDPDRYDYRRAALDAIHFPKLVDRLWQNLRRCAGFRVQYFAVVEPQQRLAPHLHAAIRGAIPRATLRQVIQATYASVWWPSHDHPVYTDTVPVWDGDQYLDPATGVVLPTWDEALDELDHDDAVPAHTLRFGTQLDMRGIIAPSAEADRAVRYLTKYLTKSIAHACTDDETTSPAREAHIDRLHDEVRWLPCSPTCANWLRYGIQPKDPGPGLVPGRCRRKAHDRETSASAGAGSWSPGNGPARPSPSTAPTGPKSSAKPSCPPASSRRRLSGWPPRSPRPTAPNASSGPTWPLMPTPTSASCSARSLNGPGAGAVPESHRESFGNRTARPGRKSFGNGPA